MRLHNDKRKLREEMKLLREMIPAQEKQEMDSRFCRAFLQMPEIAGAKTVFCYVSCGTEPDTRSLICLLLERGISVAVPRVNGTSMEFYRVAGMEDLIPGYRGILEPAVHCERAEDAQAPVLTPGLAFTEKGERIGYGGGFYDRFFDEEPEHLRIAFAYPFQIITTIPAGMLDQRVHRIITPDQVIETEEAVYGTDTDRKTGKTGSVISEQAWGDQEK